MGRKKRDAGARGPADAPISRRTFLGGVVAAPFGALPAAGAVAAAAGGGLSGAQERLLAAVLDRIIPAEGAMPAAGDAGVAAYVARVLADAPRLRPAILDLLGALGGERFVRLSDARLQRLAAERPASFQTLLHAAYSGYYSDPRVLAAAGWLPGGVPPAPFDRTALDAVRRRGPIWRDV